MEGLGGRDKQLNSVLSDRNPLISDFSGVQLIGKFPLGNEWEKRSSSRIKEEVLSPSDIFEWVDL